MLYLIIFGGRFVPATTEVGKDLPPERNPYSVMRDQSERTIDILTLS